jgi:hypothetical protein
MATKLERLENMMKWFQTAGALITMLIGAMLMWFWLDDAQGMLKGLIGLGVVMIGLIILISAWHD